MAAEEVTAALIHQDTRILCLDQAVRKTGWVLWEIIDQPALGTANGVIEKGVLQTPSKMDGAQAARWQLEKVDAKLVALAPAALALEGVQLTSAGGGGWGGPAKNIRVALQLSELRGMLMAAALLRGIPVIGVSSIEVCGFLGIPPNTRRPVKKQRAQWYALTILFGHSGAFDHSIDEISEDDADAIIIALIAQQKYIQMHQSQGQLTWA